MTRSAQGVACPSKALQHAYYSILVTSAYTWMLFILPSSILLGAVLLSCTG